MTKYNKSFIVKNLLAVVKFGWVKYSHFEGGYLYYILEDREDDRKYLYWFKPREGKKYLKIDKAKKHLEELSKCNETKQINEINTI